MVSLVVEAKGIGEVERRLTALVRAGADLAPAEDIGQHLLNTTRERFVQGEDPEGNAWLPLSGATKARKKRNVDKILTRDGYLRDIVTRASRDSVGLGPPHLRGDPSVRGGEGGVRVDAKGIADSVRGDSGAAVPRVVGRRSRRDWGARP